MGVKIVFGTNEEKENFWNNIIIGINGACPSLFGLKEFHVNEGCNPISTKTCAECWKQSGVELTISEEGSSAEERLARLREFFHTFAGDDWDEFLYEAYGQCILTSDDINFLCEYEDTDCYKKRDACKKPPLGIMPRRLWINKRISELSDAIKRYLESGTQIPDEWIKEYNDLCNEKEEPIWAKEL